MILLLIRQKKEQHSRRLTLLRLKSRKTSRIDYIGSSGPFIVFSGQRSGSVRGIQSAGATYISLQ